MLKYFSLIFVLIGSCKSSHSPNKTSVPVAQSSSPAPSVAKVTSTTVSNDSTVSPSANPEAYQQNSSTRGQAVLLFPSLPEQPNADEPYLALSFVPKSAKIRGLEAEADAKRRVEIPQINPGVYDLSARLVEGSRTISTGTVTLEIRAGQTTNATIQLK